MYADATNARSLQTIESSCMIVCLDQGSDAGDGNDDTSRALQMIHGGRNNCRNRWFDKTLQVKTLIKSNDSLF